MLFKTEGIGKRREKKMRNRRKGFLGIRSLKKRKHYIKLNKSAGRIGNYIVVRDSGRNYYEGVLGALIRGIADKVRVMPRNAVPYLRKVVKMRTIRFAERRI